MPSSYGRDRLAAHYGLCDDPCLVLVAPRSPTTRTGEHLEPMNRLSDSIIHCVHSKPNGYESRKTRRSGHFQEGDRGTSLTTDPRDLRHHSWTKGKIRIDSDDVTNWPVHARARAGLTTIVQGRGMFPKMTVRENLEMGRIASGRGIRNRLDEVLSYFPRLAERLDQASGSMSGGEQQMLAVGRGLMTDPKIMLLDEPSDGIMPLLVQQIAMSLAEINRREGMTIIIVEQNVPMVMSMAQRCIILEKGRIVASGLPDEISQDGIMQKYLAI